MHTKAFILFLAMLAAFSAGMALGIEPARAAAGLARVNSVPGRLERVSRDDEPLVVVDYSHTPDALEKALAVVRPLHSGKLICVMGCGGERESLSRLRR